MIKITNLKQYIELAKETAIYPRDEEHTYIKMGLIGEVGECFNLAKKVLRDDNGVWTEEKKDSLAHELGDVCWYLAMFANEYNDFEVIPILNLDDACYESVNEGLFSLFDWCIAFTSTMTTGREIIENMSSPFGVIYDISRKIGIDYFEVLEMNIEKLHSRKKRGVIAGSGDNR